jgi:hypothetical protein
MEPPLPGPRVGHENWRQRSSTTRGRRATRGQNEEACPAGTASSGAAQFAPICRRCFSKHLSPTTQGGSASAVWQPAIPKSPGPLMRGRSIPCTSHCDAVLSWRLAPSRRENTQICLTPAACGLLRADILPGMRPGPVWGGGSRGCRAHGWPVCGSMRPIGRKWNCRAWDDRICDEPVQGGEPAGPPGRRHVSRTPLSPLAALTFSRPHR